MLVHIFTTHDEKTTLAAFDLEKDERTSPHCHGYPHDAFVAIGTVTFDIGGIKKTVEAPATVHFPDGAEHSFKAESAKALVVCTHETRFVGT